MSEEAINAIDVPQTIEKDNAIEVKHPLQNEWDFWYFKPNRNKQNWQDNLLKIHSFSTVEDFWALYNHIELPSRLQHGSDYNLFKSGISPMWEDDANRKGGRLVILFKKQSDSNAYIKDLRRIEDKIWLETCLCMIGEAFGTDNDKICGLVYNSRGKLDRISIWTSDFEDKEGIAKIANVLKERTHVSEKIFYEKHSDEKGGKSLYMF